MKRPDGRKRRARYDAEFKLRVLKAAVAKEMTGEEVFKTFGVTATTYYAWRDVFAEGGEAALQGARSKAASDEPSPPDPAKEKLKEQVVAVKKEHPYFGIGRVWQWLRRMFFLPVSYRQIRATMKEQNLVAPPPKKRRKARKPKLHERAKPNEMWCSDITSFTIGRGLMVYLIAFMDDHSRYIVSWGLYAAATQELVLEVLKRGFDEYGYPQDILTDNGTQYKVRRGKNKFMRLMLKEDIHHLSTRPRHPEGNGKIEAFWGSVKEEFVDRAPLGVFEDVRERLGHWFNFYNWKRAQEDLDWATPAERYFQFAEEAKKEIEKRIQKNEEELAFESSRPRVGHATAGGKSVEVARHGDEFVIKLDGQEIKRSTLDPRKNTKETKDENEKGGATGSSGGDGRGGKSEGRGGPGGPVGGKGDLGGVQGDGAPAASVLQAGNPAGGSDGDDGRNAVVGAAPAQPGGGSGDAGGKDGTAPAGAPADAVPPAGLPQAAAPAEAGPEGPRKAAEGGPAAGAGGGGDGREETDAPDNGGGASYIDLP